jgi:hypothetical protein
VTIVPPAARTNRSTSRPLATPVVSFAWAKATSRSRWTASKSLCVMITWSYGSTRLSSVVLSEPSVSSMNWAKRSSSSTNDLHRIALVQHRRDSSLPPRARWSTRDAPRPVAGLRSLGSPARGRLPGRARRARWPTSGRPTLCAGNLTRLPHIYAGPPTEPRTRPRL